jgi:D-aminoacyl-tRNA deacylase
MRAVIQRVSRAAVRVDGTTVGRIDAGLLVLLAVEGADTDDTARRMASKVAGLRIFGDDDGKMNRAVGEAGGAVLCISQFTLYGDLRRGNRPSFAAAAPGDVALPLYEAFCRALEAAGLRCERGVFGAQMEVELVNDGPITLILDSRELDAPRR